MVIIDVIERHLYPLDIVTGPVDWNISQMRFFIMAYTCVKLINAYPDD